MEKPLNVNVLQNVYFHTSLKDETIALIVELVAISRAGKGAGGEGAGGKWLNPYPVDGDCFGHFVVMEKCPTLH